MLLVLLMGVLIVTGKKVEMTFYEDGSCSSEGNPITKHNPFVCSVGACCEYQGADSHVQFHSCSGSTVKYTAYSGPNGCSNSGQGVNGGSAPVGKCINLGGGGEIFSCID